MGSTLGPVLGGVITGLLGWRWVLWVVGIMVCDVGLFWSVTDCSIRLEYVSVRCVSYSERRTRLHFLADQMMGMIL